MNAITHPPAEAGLGHNKPPATIYDISNPEERRECIKALIAPEITVEIVRGANVQLLDRVDEVKASAAKVPAKIETDDHAAKSSDVLKVIGKTITALNAAKKVATEPYKSADRAAGAVFQKPADELGELKADIAGRTQPFLDAKKAAEEERRRKAADEARERELEALRRAEAAEAAARVAEEQKRKAQEEADRARAERDAQLAEARRAQEEADRAKAEAARIEVERKALLKRQAEEAAEAARIKAKDEAEAAARKERLAAQLAELDRLAAQRAEQQAKADAERRAADAARDEAVRQRAKKDAAEKDAAEAAKLQKTAERQEAAANKQAVAADKHAGRVELALEQATPAELSRVRGDFGSVSSLGQYWKATVIDYDKLDKNRLWPHIHREAIDHALTKWMNEQNATPEARRMPGAVMEQIAGIRTS